MQNLWLTSRNTRNGFSSPLHVGLGYMHLASWSLKLSGTWVLGCLFALILLTELDEDQFYLAHLWTAFQSCLVWKLYKKVFFITILKLIVFVWFVWHIQLCNCAHNEDTGPELCPDTPPDPLGQRLFSAASPEKYVPPVIKRHHRCM